MNVTINEEYKNVNIHLFCSYMNTLYSPLHLNKRKFWPISFRSVDDILHPSCKFVDNQNIVRFEVSTAVTKMIIINQNIVHYISVQQCKPNALCQVTAAGLTFI
jgi:hypothetical protein